MTKSNVQVNSNEVVVSSTVTVDITELLSSIPVETLAHAIEDRMTDDELIVIGRGDELNEMHKTYLRRLLVECSCCECDDEDEEYEEYEEEELPEEVIEEDDDTIIPLGDTAEDLNDDEEDEYEEDDDEELTAEQLLQAITKFLGKK